MFNEEPEFYEYTNPDEALKKFECPMDEMYEFAIGTKCFSSTLIETDTHYFQSNTGGIIATYSLDGSNFKVYPFAPTNITIDDMKEMLKHYEELEEYEKCINLLKIINEIERNK